MDETLYEKLLINWTVYVNEVKDRHKHSTAHQPDNTVFYTRIQNETPRTFNDDSKVTFYTNYRAHNGGTRTIKDRTLTLDVCTHTRTHAHTHTPMSLQCNIYGILTVLYDFVYLRQLQKSI
jgi:hypothetical protein